eukprot:TRINITY_DN31048_c0_g1_i1.p1 TRINITY_DN31048_c0_g1~~TRINITY_DN31048_c0_g1_i1.p1  ORF type:complete len:658 (+),score=82.87 TRINITY_DN31048_c0_g1_i1:60-1976(+)
MKPFDRIWEEEIKQSLITATNNQLAKRVKEGVRQAEHREISPRLMNTLVKHAGKASVRDGVMGDMVVRRFRYTKAVTAKSFYLAMILNGLAKMNNATHIRQLTEQYVVNDSFRDVDTKAVTAMLWGMNKVSVTPPQALKQSILLRPFRRRYNPGQVALIGSVLGEESLSRIKEYLLSTTDVVTLECMARLLKTFGDNKSVRYSIVQKIAHNPVKAEGKQFFRDVTEVLKYLHKHDIPLEREESIKTLKATKYLIQQALNQMADKTQLLEPRCVLSLFWSASRIRSNKNSSSWMSDGLFSKIARDVEASFDIDLKDPASVYLLAQMLWVFHKEKCKIPAKLAQLAAEILEIHPHHEPFTRTKLHHLLKDSGSVGTRISKLEIRMKRRDGFSELNTHQIAMVLQSIRYALGRVPADIVDLAVERIARTGLRNATEKGVASILNEVNEGNMALMVMKEIEERGLHGIGPRAIGVLAYCHARAGRYSTRFWEMLEEVAKSDKSLRFDLKSCFLVSASVLRVKKTLPHTSARVTQSLLELGVSDFAAREAARLAAMATMSPEPSQILLSHLSAIIVADPSVLSHVECVTLARGLVQAKIPSPELFKALRDSAAMRGKQNTKGGQPYSAVAVRGALFEEKKSFA